MGGEEGSEESLTRRGPLAQLDDFAPGTYHGCLPQPLESAAGFERTENQGVSIWPEVQQKRIVVLENAQAAKAEEGDSRSGLIPSTECHII